MSEVSPENPDVYAVLRVWEDEYHDPNYDPIPMLTALAELIESEAEEYMKKDPDPFDERHPSRAFPNSSLGHTLKVLFRKEAFMTKLVNDYLRDNYYQRLGISGRDVRQLNIAACRLMLDITPGLETNAVFELPASDALVHRLFSWAEKSIEPLQTYATGLLAAAMEVQEIAVAFRDQNLRLVPLMLERLHQLQSEAVEERTQLNNVRPFAEFSKSDCDSSRERLRGNSVSFKSPTKMDVEESDENKDKAVRVNGCSEGFLDKINRRPSNEGLMSPPHTPTAPPISVHSARQTPFNMSDCSNSSWAEMEAFVIGTVQMHPLTLATRQLFILKYLTPMGEYQEFLSHVFEKNALVLILQFINLRETKHARLSFEALKYLASLLCHKKFSIEFINVNGLQRLLEVPRPSIAATGVSICLYYLAYCEDAVERVCLLPQPVLSDLVRYALWLLECSHDSGRCHATMFFGLSFQFRVVLEEFDKQDGLRKLYNVICTLPILRVEDALFNEDEECSARQIVRHVCVALKRYLEAHLSLRAEQVRRAHLARDSSGSSHVSTTENSKLGSAVPGYKACKSGPEEVRDEINTLLELMSYRTSWPPVDNLIRLGGLTLLLQVIAFAYEWNNSGRAETVRCALDVLGICAVMPRAQMQLCEKVDLPDETNTVGINVILKAAEGEIVSDPDVQRAALNVIITCVCAPIHRVGSITQRPLPSTSIASSLSGSSRRRAHVVRSSEEIIEKMWECLRKTNGIMVLLALIQKRLPLTDSDSIRSLACQALAGLARSETVRQIISKLPLFTSGSLQILMKNPILPDRRQEHVLFQKYALELLERVSGKSKPRNELEPSLANIHRANVIAQTRITYNQRELFQLIQQHLAAHGMNESAETLAKEANLPPIKPANSIGFVSSVPPFLSPFTYELAQACGRTGGRASLKVSSQTETPQQAPSSLATGPILVGQSPIRLNINSPGQRKLNNETKQKLDAPRADQSAATQALIARLEKRDSFREPVEQKTITPPAITLDTIVTEYLMNQHSLCKNPMATCPQFTLLEHHKCPDPKSRVRLPNNIALRHARGAISRRLDQRFIHSRFSCVHIFRFGDENTFFTCCDFFKNDRYIAIGSQQGDVKLFNVQTGSEVTSHHCHESIVSHLACARTRPLMLTSSLWRAPLSTCWKVTDNSFTPVLSMDEEDYVEFNKFSEDRIIGTKSETATIYDVETKNLLQTLKPTMSNLYTKNRATFSPTNELVLSDGVLWDVNSGKEIHKFDKLNQTLSGVFHPNGLEIISNTEVWDLRTFHLLRTVPELDHCDVLFSPAGYTLYCLTADHDAEEENQFQNSFKTLDAYDYSCIATIDVKKYIYDLACNGKDTQIALVENQREFGSVEESIVKIYDVGRSRSTDDEEEDEDEEESMDASDGSGSDDDQPDESMALDELLQLQSDDDDSNTSSSISMSSSDARSVFNQSDQDGEDDNNDDDGNGVVRMNGDIMDASSDSSDDFGDAFF